MGWKSALPACLKFSMYSVKMKFHQNHVCFRAAHAPEHVEFSALAICKNFSEQGCYSETAESFTCVNE